MEILRKILGPIHEGGKWRIRCNNKLYTTFDDPEMSIIINLEKLQLGGLMERIPKCTLKGKLKVDTL